MAKSARASVRKRNNAVIRSKLFGPAVDARTERLSAKLQELAAKPRPEQEKAMELDTTEDASEDLNNGTTVAAPDVEDVEMHTGSTTKRISKKSRSSRIEKKSTTRSKPRNQVVFPTSANKRKRIASSKRKSV